MSPAPDLKSELSLEEIDLIAINEFRKLKNTSVLTIMFTDIKGFTKMTETKGEEYSNVCRRKHDEILVGIIEENQSGKVIKHIGDAVMAIFAEPSMAVERALKIQKEMKIAEQTIDELGGLTVRIGLHMGQVTTEDNVSLDVFGRHVNRASRVESLADGGQVYLTYPVFDSAKGWLTSNEKEIEWYFHGAYFVKGIEHPIEIYEVIAEKLVKPKPPKKAKKKKAVPTWMILLCLMALCVLGSFGWSYFDRATVTFTYKGLPIVKMDHGNEVPVDGDEKESLRKVLISMPQGKHLLHYDTRRNGRSYAEIEIKRGENFIRPEFKYYGLPYLSKNLYMSSGGPRKEAKDEVKKSYKYYKNINTIVEAEVFFKGSLVSIKDPNNEKQVKITYSWELQENGVVINKDTLEINRDLNDREEFKKKIVLKKNERVYYYVEVTARASSAYLRIIADYIEYLKE
ncbi:MAG: hypothetical protein COA79_09110 [Planctomycetota bacterium]|nr:MAG: hypothetical protein COA79_09110 [Planctomycetota bacterium]